MTCLFKGSDQTRVWFLFGLFGWGGRQTPNQTFSISIRDVWLFGARFVHQTIARSLFGTGLFGRCLVPCLAVRNPKHAH
jgi:hypothetical protein